MKIISGKTTVTTAGTEVALYSADLCVHSVEIKAAAANNGTVYVGNDGTAGAGAVSSTTGFEVAKGTSVKLEAGKDELINLKNILVDSTSSGDTVSWIVVY